MCMHTTSALHAPHKAVLSYMPVHVHLCCESIVKYLSVPTDSVVLLWCKKGSCLAEGEAIMAPLWIMRQKSDPCLKVNISSCPCHSHNTAPHYVIVSGPGSVSLQTILLLTRYFVLWCSFQIIFFLNQGKNYIKCYFDFLLI